MREVLLCSPVLEVRCWRFAEYLDASDLTAPPPLIEPSKVLSQACRLATHIPRQRTAAPRAPDSLHSDMNMDDEEVELEDAAPKLSRFKSIENTNYAAGLGKQNSMHSVGIQDADIADGRHTLVLGLT